MFDEVCFHIIHVVQDFLRIELRTDLCYATCYDGDYGFLIPIFEHSTGFLFRFLEF